MIHGKLEISIWLLKKNNIKQNISEQKLFLNWYFQIINQKILIKISKILLAL